MRPAGVVGARKMQQSAGRQHATPVSHQRPARTTAAACIRRPTVGAARGWRESSSCHGGPQGGRRLRPGRRVHPKVPQASPQAPDTGVELFSGAECMEDVVDALADSLLAKVANLPADGSKYVVGIAGPPGGGKSTLATMVSQRLNKLAAAEVSVVFPMDGFHFYRNELDQMEDPAEAHAKRGAHWTFNAQAFLDCLRRIVSEGSGSAPSFDHAVGDPVEKDILIDGDQQIVLVEGNYLLLDLEPWNSLPELFDQSWYVDTDVDVAMQRILSRQVAIGLKPEASLARISGNDRPNAVLVAATASRADLLVPSLPLRRG